MKKVWKKVFDFADDVLAYILTLICIMFSNVVPMIGGTEPIIVDVSVARIIGSSLVALLLTLWQEYNRPDSSGDKVKSKEGKKKRFLQRMINAMIFGLGASEIMNKILSTITIG